MKNVFEQVQYWEPSKNGSDYFKSLPQHVLSSVGQNLIFYSFDPIMILEAPSNDPRTHKIIFANDALLKMTGYSYDEVIGHTPELFVGELTDKTFFEHFLDNMHSGDVFRATNISYKKDGSHYYSKWVVSFIKDQDDKITHAVAIQQDITLLTEYSKYNFILSQALQNTEEGVIITDEKFNIQFINKGFEEMSGYTANELIGTNAKQLTYEKESQYMFEQMLENAQKSKDFKGVFAYRRKDGKVVYLDKVFIPVRNSDNKVVNYVSINHNITTQVLRERSLIKVATVDKMTGALVRNAGEEQLQSVVFKSRSLKQELCIAMIDIDFFKKVNDTWGHPIGDSVLKELGMLMKEHLRDSDTLVRWGGEEFLAILPHCNIAEAQKTMERCRLEVAQHSFDTVGRITISIGIAELDCNDLIESFIEKADKALYHAKHCGRNLVVAHDYSKPDFIVFNHS